MPGILRNLLDNLWGLATSDTIGVTVAEPPPLVEVLTISVDKTTMEAGTTDKVVFTGQYTIDGKAIASQDLSLYCDGVAVKGGITDSGGYYSIYWRTTTPGTYSFYTKTAG